jgi:type II secretory pathway component PulF
MPIFQYVAMSQRGEKKSSLTLADSKAEVLDEINRKGYFSIEIREIATLPKLKKITPTKILEFTQELYQFLKAKIPLYDALKNIQKKNLDPNMQILLIGILDQLKQGHLFSKALESYAAIFDPIYITIVKAGEETGKLDVSFLSLKISLEKELLVKKKISSQLAYPKFLAFVSFLLIIGVLTFLVPTFKDLIDVKNQKGITKVVFGLSDSLLSNPQAYVSLLLSLGLLIWLGKRLSFIQGIWLKAQLKVFPFKNFYVPKIFLRFSLIFSSLLEASVPLVDALKYSKKVVHHPLIESDIELVIQSMKEGASFENALKKAFFIPETVIQIVASREETGSYVEAFKTIGSIYEEELERNLQQLSTYIQPAMFLLLGLLIGIIILSVMLPLSDTTNFQM